MSPRCTLILLLVLASTLRAQAEDKPPVPAAQSQIMSADQAILFWQERVKRDPEDGYSWTMLGYTFIRKARETGDFAGYEKAEEAINKALKLDKNYLPARANLVMIRSARHQFAEGLALAQELYTKDPREASLLILIGDAHLELGNYDQADKAYRDYLAKDPTLTLPTRLSRLAELKGDTSQAIKLMETAAEEDRQAGGSKESGAWYQARLGEMYFNAGRLQESERHYEAALKGQPAYYVALAGLGRVRAAQGKTAEAIALLKKAAAVSPDPLVLTPLGDLCVKTGDEFLAKVVHGQLEKAARGQPAYNRELAHHYADHGKNLPEAVELARKDLETRKDIYAHDTLAWALCRNQRYQEAAAAMKEALKLGTKDASLFYHAGMIHLGLGDREKARDYLEKALATNPHFSILHAEEARKTLAELKP